MRYIIYQKLNKKHWYISMLSRILLIPYILNFQMKLAAESKRGEKGQRVKWDVMRVWMRRKAGWEMSID